MSNFVLKVFLCLLLLVTWKSGLDKVSTEIQGLSSTDCNFQGLTRCVESCLYYYVYRLLFGILSVRILYWQKISLKFLHRSFLPSTLHWGNIHTWNSPWVDKLYFCIYPVPRSLNQFLSISFFLDTLRFMYKFVPNLELQWSLDKTNLYRTKFLI